MISSAAGQCGHWEQLFESLHCGKKDRKFPSQITDAADHNKPVTENSGIKFPTFLSDCSAIYIEIFFRNIFWNLDMLSFNMRLKNIFEKEVIYSYILKATALILIILHTYQDLNP
jgi:hypothetical protein